MNNNEKTFFIIMMSMAPFAMAQTIVNPMVASSR